MLSYQSPQCLSLLACFLPVIPTIICISALIPRSTLLSLAFPEMGVMLPEDMFVSPLFHHYR